MVFKKDKPIIISGTCDPNKTLVVRLENTLKYVSSNQNGNWTVNFPPVDYSNSFNIYVEGVNETIELHNVVAGKVIVLVGDSWLTDNLADIEQKTISNEENPRVRYFQPSFSYDSKESFNAEWKILSRGNISIKERLARVLGQQFSEKDGEYIGVINLILPGMDIRTFDSKQIQIRDTALKSNIDSAWISYFNTQKTVKSLSDSSCNAIEKGILERIYKDNDWAEMNLPIEVCKNRYLKNHIVWLRKKILIPEKYTHSSFQLDIGHINGKFDFYFNGAKIKSFFGEEENLIIQIPESILRVWANDLTIRMVGDKVLTGIYSDKIIFHNNDDSYKVSLNEDWKYRTYYEKQLPESQRNKYLYPDINKKWLKYISLPEADELIIAGSSDFYKNANKNSYIGAFSFLENSFKADKKIIFLTGNNGKTDSLVNSEINNEITNNLLFVSAKYNWEIINIQDLSVKADDFYQLITERLISVIDKK